MKKTCHRAKQAGKQCCAFFLTLLAFNAYAQPTTPDSGILLRDQPDTPQTIQQLPDRDALPPPLPDTGVRTELRKVTFEGYEGLASEEELQAIVEDFIGQKLGFNGLQYLADLITEHLKEKGYFLAFAYLPEQDISDGKLVIMIQPGRIAGGGEWIRTVKEGEGINLSNKRIFKTLNHHLLPEGDQPAEARRMERGILLFNDLAGVTARSTLERGRLPGTTNVRTRFITTPRYTGNLWADNYGNRYTGEVRVNALGNINNLSGMGDRLTGMVTQTRWMSYANLGYQAPLGYQGLTGNLSLSYMRYELGKELEDLDYDGDAITAQAGLSYPMIRSRVNNLYLQGGYEFKALDDEQAGNNIRDRKFHNLNLGVEGDFLDRRLGGGLNNYAVTLTLGNLDRKGNQADYNGDQATAATQGTFSKINFNATRLQRLSGDLSLLVQASGQYSLDNLDSSEQFSVGGPNGVRAYPSGEISGDHGWQATLETRYDLSGFNYFNSELQINAFYDLGGVTLRQDEWTGYTPPNSNETGNPVIMGAGIGAVLSRPQVYSLRTSLAFKINDEIADRQNTNLSTRDADGKSRDPRLWVQLMAWF